MSNVIRFAGSAPFEVPIENVERPEHPLRVPYEGEAQDLRELGESLLAEGQGNPIQVFDMGGGRYRTVTGDRRLQALRAVGAQNVWISVIDERSEADTIILQLVENLQRKNPEPYEEAAAYQRLLNDHKFTVAEIAHRVKRRPAYVRERLLFASAAAGVHEHVVAGSLSPGAAAAIAREERPQAQVAIAQAVVEQGLTIGQTKRLVSRSRTSPLRPQPQPYILPEKATADIEWATRSLYRIGKRLNFKALTSDNLKTMRAAVEELVRAAGMVGEQLSKAAKSVPAASSPASVREGNVPTARNHGDEWPAAHLKILEDWVANRRLGSIDDIAKELGRQPSAVQWMAREIRRKRRRAARK